MKPMTPPELTASQKVQLSAGESKHATTTLAFDVHGGMFYYVPNVIKVKKGDTVKINFLNDGGHHDFNLDEFGFKIAASDGGKTSTGQFIADKVGSFEYYCSIGSHRKMGQKGTLVVTE
jgi:plastocyanin